MKIHRIVSDLLDSNMYIVEENGRAVLIDPCAAETPAAGLQVDWILLTHEHYDHISGVNAWKERCGAPVLCSESCAKNIQDPRKNFARYFTDMCEIQTWIRLDRTPEVEPDYSCRADQVFTDQFNFTWQGHRLKLAEIPGHSRGSIGIWLDDTDFFSGDSLIPGHDIALRFPGGSRKLWEEVGKQRISDLPAGVHVWPGHFENFVLLTEADE